MKIRLYNGREFDLPKHDAEALVKCGKAVFIEEKEIQEVVKPKPRKKVNND